MHKPAYRSFIFLASCCVYLFRLPLPVFAQTWTAECFSEGDVATLKGLECLFGNILGVALRLLGLATFIVIVVGGYKYLTSGGDPKATESAQSTITYGVIGLVLAIAAWFILQAISGFTGIQGLLNFELVNPNP